MTSEVLLMNRNAVAIAADSAVTLSMRGSERKYLKGVNKVFQLSDTQPVGIMVFSSATLNGVPWEIIIKAFRRELARTAYGSVKDYGAQLFDYIQSLKPRYFNATRQKAIFHRLGEDVAVRIFETVDKDPTVISANDKKAARDAALLGISSSLAAEQLRGQFAASPNVLPDAKAAHATAIRARIENILSEAGLGTAVDMDLLTDVAIEIIYKRYEFFCPGTGIVVAGFGEDDFFPSYVHYECYGFINDVFVLNVVKESAVDPDGAVSLIEPFAAKDMVETFMLGISPDVYKALQAGVDRHVGKFAADIAIAAPGIADLTTQMSSCNQSILAELTGIARNEHYFPLVRAIGSLPVDQLAHLAETLIMLESLKEKVTRPSESVGGAVDVAVITRAEGLVWVKRKHYFPPELNPKYFDRLRPI